LIIFGKLWIWEYRKNKRLPNVRLFQKKIGIKGETERFIAYKKQEAPRISQEMGAISVAYFRRGCVDGQLHNSQFLLY